MTNVVDYTEKTVDFLTRLFGFIITSKSDEGGMFTINTLDNIPVRLDIQIKHDVEHDYFFFTVSFTYNNGKAVLGTNLRSLHVADKKVTYKNILAMIQNSLLTTLAANGFDKTVAHFENMVKKLDKEA